MNTLNDNSIENIYLNKNVLTLKKRIKDERKKSFELTNGSMESTKIKEKPKNSDYYKKIKKIKDIISNTNQSYNQKETPSYQNSYFPICLSFMTNTKNYLNSIDSKFKIRNGFKLLHTKTIEDYSILYNNNSLLNNNNKSAVNKDNKKINLNLNIEKTKDFKKLISNIKFEPDKIKHSRNFKHFKFSDSTDNNGLNIKKYNFFADSMDKSINIYNPKKIINNENKNNIKKIKNKTLDIEDIDDDQLRFKIKLINKFVNMNLSKKKLQNALNEKAKISLNIKEQLELMRNDSLPSLKRNLNNTSKNNKKESLIVPKIVTYNNPNVNKQKIIFNKNETDKNNINENTAKSNKSIIKINNKKIEKNNNRKIEKYNNTNNEKDNNKITEKLNSSKIKKDKIDKKVGDNKIIIKEENKNISIDKKDKKSKIKKSKKKKHKYERSNKIRKSYINYKKTPSINNKIKFINITLNKEIKKTINDINNNFIKEIKEDNDNITHQKLDNQIESNKISILLNNKTNIDKIISRQKERLKPVNPFPFDLNKYISDEDDIKEIYKYKIRKYGKIYLKLKKFSILFILFYNYISIIDKCALDNNMLNYIRLHVEFSSIYLPVVNFGEEKPLLITDKLFSFKQKKNNNILQMVKTKFVEKKKYKKGVQIISLNFITKELLYYNMHSEDINYLDDENSEILESDETSKNKKTYYNSSKKILYVKKKGISLYRRNSVCKKIINPLSLSLLEKKGFFDLSKKRIENKIKYSINTNILHYKLRSNNRYKSNINHNLNIKDKINEQYVNKAMSLLHDHKIKKDTSNQNVDYFELLRKITGKENIQNILRAFILEGETLLFAEYFNNNYRRIDINAKDEDGNTFLILSVKQELNYITNLLLERGVDINIQNKEGNTALHYALSAKNFILADLLKKFGAKEDCYNKLGYTPWDCVGKSIEIHND